MKKPEENDPRNLLLQDIKNIETVCEVGYISSVCTVMERNVFVVILGRELL